MIVYLELLVIQLVIIIICCVFEFVVVYRCLLYTSPGVPPHPQGSGLQPPLAGGQGGRAKNKFQKHAKLSQEKAESLKKHKIRDHA